MPMRLLNLIVTVSLICQPVFADILFDCDFETSECGFIDDTSTKVRWIRNQGETPSSNSGPSTDHTLTNATGWYMYAEASSTDVGDKARMYTQLIERTAGTCTVIDFYYNMNGDNTGELNVYLLGEKPYYFVNPVWQVEGENRLPWQFVRLQVFMSVNYSIAFETIFARSGVVDKNGDVAIDDISVDTMECSFSSCKDNGVFCLNGGTCVEITDGSDLQLKCECADGFSGDYCENDFDECAVSPCQNGGVCTHGLNELNCQCQIGYYGYHCENIDGCYDADLRRCENGGTCSRDGNNFICTCAPGFTDKICSTDIDDCSTNPCINGGQCSDGVNSYTCNCAAEYYGYNCQSLAGSCDFEDNDLQACGYITTDYPQQEWILITGRTTIGSTGPLQDHTTGYGYYLYADVDNNEADKQRRTARLVSPKLPQASVGKCTNVTFWYFMEGDDVGTLNVYTMSESNSVETVPFWSMSGAQGINAWASASIQISSTVPYKLVFDAVSKRTVAIASNYIGLDDILVAPDTCVYEYCSVQPCKNEGVCYEDNGSYRCECIRTWTGVNCTEDRNECAEGTPCLNGGNCQDANPGYICACPADYTGYSCEYIKGSCDFDDPNSPFCDYKPDNSGDFGWTRNKGPTTSDLSGPATDHTFGTADGYYLYVEASDRVGGDRARIISPEVPDSGSQCTGVDFWYHMYGSDIGELAVYVKFGTEEVTTPVWNTIGSRNVSRNEWQSTQLNISAPNNFMLVFEATVLPQSIIEPDNRGDIAIDDIVVHYDRSCTYDKCFLNPCKNGATCITLNDDYRCDCTPGYDGRDCDNVPACTPNPCGNGGTCVLGSDGGEECLCMQGWFGDRCETKDLCYPNQCENGGTCTSFATTFSCSCPDGYLGPTCQTDINECESSPCRNGATCVDLPNAWRCDCKGSYLGEQCNTIEGGCNFQADFCDWKSESEDYQWIRYSGPSPNWPTSGPRVDHTYSNNSGVYIYTPVYSDQPNAPTRYRLVSPTFEGGVLENGQILTLEFWYHMAGSGMGTLLVHLIESTGPKEIGRVVKGGVSSDWQQFTKTVQPTSDFSFAIEHETVDSPFYFADMAIDDIALIVEGGFSSQTTTPLTTKTPPTTTEKTTAVATTEGVTTTPVPTPTTTVKTSTVTKTDALTETTTEPDFSSTTTHCPNCLGDGGDDGLTGGAIAGIVIGVLAGVGLATIGLLYYRKKEYSNIDQSSKQVTGVDNKTYKGDEESL